VGGLNETQRYFVEEHIEDFRDGLITRRELVRRVGLIAGSAAAGTTILAACDLSPRTGAGASPTAPAGTSVGGGAAPTAGLVAASPFATPPAAATTDGVTVKPDDPRITVSKPEVKGADGASLMAYLAEPNVSGRVPGVVVVHENRGQTEHIRDVVRRVATAGFIGLNIDLAARDGGADRLTDQAAYNAALGKRSTADKLSDHKAAIDFLRSQSSGSVGVTGFCFGGGETWSILIGGLDAGHTHHRHGAQMEEQLRKAGVPYQLTVYPGVNHAFHNDTSNRYYPTQAQKAWVSTVEWFRRYL
jgi:carboxymethylenebutenolidase